MECCVTSCENKTSQGRFVGRFCKPCYIQMKNLEKVRSEMKCTEAVKSELMVNFPYYSNKLKEDLEKVYGVIVLCLVQGTGMLGKNPRKEYLKRVSEGVYVTADGVSFGTGWTIKEL